MVTRVLTLLQRSRGIGKEIVAYVVHLIRQSLRESEQVQQCALQLALVLAEHVDPEKLVETSSALLSEIETVFWPGGGVIAMGTATPLAFKTFGSFARQLAERPSGEGRALALKSAPQMHGARKVRSSQPRVTRNFFGGPTSEMGVQDPVGFWDPLGLSADKDQATFKRRRAVEIKHGRIAMPVGRIIALARLVLNMFEVVVDGVGITAAARKQEESYATIGYIVPEYFRFPGFFQAASTTDGRGPREGQFSMKDSTETGEPGNYGVGFPTFVGKVEDPEERKKKLAAELANGRLAMMAIIGEGVVGKKGPSPTFDPSTQIGAMDPLGFFDPAGFSKKGDEDGFRTLRAAEIKHGRVAMMAALGAVVQHYVKFPGFDSVPSGLAASITAPGSYGFVALFAVAGILELGAWTESPDKEPGNFGDPAGLNQYTQEMREREINNGRFAMFAAIGIIAAELYTGKDAIEQFGLPRMDLGDIVRIAASDELREAIGEDYAELFRQRVAHVKEVDDDDEDGTLVSNPNESIPIRPSEEMPSKLRGKALTSLTGIDLDVLSANLFGCLQRLEDSHFFQLSARTLQSRLLRALRLTCLWAVLGGIQLTFFWLALRWVWRDALWACILAKGALAALGEESLTSQLDVPTVRQMLLQVAEGQETAIVQRNEESINMSKWDCSSISILTEGDEEVSSEGGHSETGVQSIVEVQLSYFIPPDTQHFDGLISAALDFVDPAGTDADAAVLADLQEDAEFSGQQAPWSPEEKEAARRGTMGSGRTRCFIDIMRAVAGVADDVCHCTAHVSRPEPTREERDRERARREDEWGLDEWCLPLLPFPPSISRAVRSACRKQLSYSQLPRLHCCLASGTPLLDHASLCHWDARGSGGKGPDEAPTLVAALALASAEVRGSAYFAEDVGSCVHMDVLSQWTVSIEISQFGCELGDELRVFPCCNGFRVVYATGITCVANCSITTRLAIMIVGAISSTATMTTIHIIMLTIIILVMAITILLLLLVLLLSSAVSPASFHPSYAMQHFPDVVDIHRLP
ncbi:Fucoxanthin-chlorophyll a-c binding protein A, chloroplastic [Symbiodinium microadriaticum]|uniref:Fucoxanthin-chlorophyll a-c binding protein A, chloroplastic n=1 Tax=Symbiodinium microadriaticum TaxID=2951 RepID=A0A1Q9EGN2_SYMMI|nr:Fucoxanthin-chlorophyll a-c binding protein A, chloroplastic [Symbiodinium microadriaticum]